MIGEDFRHLPSVHDPDPALAAAREARTARAKAQALAAEEKLAKQRERLARADQLLGMLASVATDPTVDVSERIKAASGYLDRVLPRVKSVEVQLDGAVQVDQRHYIAPAERVAALPFDEALADAMRRLQQYDAQRGALVGEAVRIEHDRGGDHDE